MKRLIAILFLSIFLFNLYGYRLLISYWQSQAEISIQAKAAQTPESDLVSIKVATVLPPYTYASNTYESITGEVDVHGMTYKYVKRRIFKDSIEFLCVPHIAKKRLENAREEFFRLSNDLQNASDQKKSSNTIQIKPVVFEYCSLTDNYTFTSLNTEVNFFYTILTPYKPSRFSCSVDHPPEAVTV